MFKPLVRLYPLDIERINWRRPEGMPDGTWERILASEPASGSATRLLRAEPGVQIAATTLDCWEEAFVLEGGYKCGDEFFPRGSYLCSRPRAEQAAIYTAEGFVSIQFRDFHDASMDKPPVRLDPLAIERIEWEPLANLPVAGVRQKTLTLGPSGSGTRLLRTDAHTVLGVFSHNFGEEVLILEGSYKMGDEFHPTGTFTSKGPHVEHGPFTTNEGFVCLEVRTFA